jgi:hypothetical protein
MLLAATPSIGGYTVGYDLDGVIKQKDSLGNIVPLFGNTSQNLSQTLLIGNDTSLYSIMMGTNSTIFSSATKNSINLNYLGGVLISSTASGATSSLNIKQGSTYILNVESTNKSEISLQSRTFSTTITSSTQSSYIEQKSASFKIHFIDYNSPNPVSKAFETGGNYNINNDFNSSYVHINSNNATTNSGVINSVVIGGENLTAYENYTVYLGNNVNINNKYTLPNQDGINGQFLKTNGSGQIEWANAVFTTSPLKDVLQAGNNSEGYSIIMGTGTGIFSSNGNTAILLDSNGSTSLKNSILISTNGTKTNSNWIQLVGDTNPGLYIGATSATITINDKKGLVYAADYSSTFVDNSLVTKKYVDSLSNSTISTYKIAYVDPLNGSDTTGVVNRMDKPYATVAKATAGLTASYTFIANDRGLVHLKKGTYVDTVIMSNYINYYCEPGVLFNNNGFSDVSGAVISNVLGYAEFRGTNPSLVPLDIRNSSVVYFEFKEIDNTSVAIRITNETSSFSDIKIKGDSIINKSTLGRTILIGSQAGTTDVRSNVDINVKNITGAYDVLDIRPRFSGSVYVNSKSIICDSSISPNGALSNFQHAVVVRSASASVSIVSDIYDIISDSSFVTFLTGNDSAVYAGNCNLNIKGNIYGGNFPGIYIDGTFGTFSYSGDISSRCESFIGSGNGVSFNAIGCRMKSDGLGASTYVIDIKSGSMSSYYIRDCELYNTLVDSESGIMVLTTTQSKVGIYNSLGYVPGVNGQFIYSSVTASVGIHNTRSNKDNSELVEDLFTPSGFIYDPNLYIGGF